MKPFTRLGKRAADSRPVGQALVGSNLRPNTVTTYRYALAAIVAQLGHQRLSRVTPRALAGAFATLQRQNRGRRSLHQAYVYRGAWLSRAVVLRLLGTNPLRQIPGPAYLATERCIWTMEQARRF